jgi:hypothetical protein
MTDILDGIWLAFGPFIVVVLTVWAIAAIDRLAK